MVATIEGKIREVGFIVAFALVALCWQPAIAAPAPAEGGDGRARDGAHRKAAKPSATKGDAEAKARAAYLRARAHYEAKRYEKAVAELKKAYELQPLPALLRYIGDSYYMMKKYRPALEFYRTYLARTRGSNSETDKSRARIEKRVGALERRIRAEEQATSGSGEGKQAAELLPDGSDTELPAELQPTPPPQARAAEAAPTVSPSDRGALGTVLQIAKWSALGISVAALAVGVTFHVLAKNEAGDLQDAVREACPTAAPSCGGNPNLDRPVTGYTPEQYEMQRSYLRQQNRSIGFFVGAGAAAAAAIVLFVLDWPKGSTARNVSLAPALGPKSLLLSGQGRF